MKIRSLDDNAQILAVLSIILVTSVIVISTLGAEIANIDFLVSSKTESYLQTEFLSIKETFGNSLNYNLGDVDSNTLTIESETRVEGDIEYIETAFENTKNHYLQLELSKGYLFDANLNLYWYGYEETYFSGASLVTDIIYYIDVTLMLDDGDSNIIEDIIYSISLIK